MGPTKLRKEPLEMVFIRAPIIESVGKGIEVLAEDAGAPPVLVQHGRVLAPTFHPELDRRHDGARTFQRCRKQLEADSLIVIFGAEVGDEIFAHHPAQRVFQLHRLDEEVVLGIKLAARTSEI